MNSDLSLQSIGNMVKPLLRYHYLIFILFVLGFSGYVVFSILSTINASEDLEYKTQKSTAVASDKFDDETIDRIKKFHYSDQSTTVTLPSGPINPFAE